MSGSRSKPCGICRSLRTFHKLPPKLSPCHASSDLHSSRSCIVFPPRTPWPLVSSLSEMRACSPSCPAPQRWPQWPWGPCSCASWALWSDQGCCGHSGWFSSCRCSSASPPQSFSSVPSPPLARVASSCRCHVCSHQLLPQLFVRQLHWSCFPCFSSLRALARDHSPSSSQAWHSSAK